VIETNVLRHNALQPKLADVIEDRRAVAEQVIAVLDRAPCRGLADQFGEPSLA